MWSTDIGRIRASLLFSCEESDSVMILVVINGNKERIDKYCSKHPPVQVMSNGPVMIVHFRSHSASPSLPGSLVAPSLPDQRDLSVQTAVRQGHRGFTATYRFITGELSSSSLSAPLLIDLLFSSSSSSDFGITGGVQDPKRGGKFNASWVHECLGQPSLETAVTMSHREKETKSLS